MYNDDERRLKKPKRCKSVPCMVRKPVCSINCRLKYITKLCDTKT